MDKAVPVLPGPYLCYFAARGTWRVLNWDDQERQWTVEHGEILSPSHWAFLPAAPEVEHG